MRRGLIITLAGLSLVVTVSAASGAAATDGLVVHRSAATGAASFVTAVDGHAIPVAPSAGQRRATPADFLAAHGALFGIDDPATQLVQLSSRNDALGYTHTAFQQVHRGVRVFAGVLKLHQDSNGDFKSAGGDFFPISPLLDATPALAPDAAADAARAALDTADAAVETSELVIVDPGWYGDRSIGAHVAYYLILTDLAGGVREAFFVDAQDGAILDKWSVLHTARWREVYDGLGGQDLPGALARAEGDPPVASPEDVNRAYDYAGDVYDCFDRAYGRDSIDDNGMTLILTANSAAAPCPNAFWDGTQMVFCAGTVTDDITAHEVMHGITGYTAGLVYQNQSGQLNESYSDVFGEVVDLLNGDVSAPGAPSGPPFWPAHGTGPGLDTPNGLRSRCSYSPSHVDGVRWLLGEDAAVFGGAIRDMWDPTCMGHPDRAMSPLQTCNPSDNGGVHSGSGVPNHAFAMLTDGATFNGYTINGIGLFKVAAVWYRALNVYLTPASDFEDAYVALNFAAGDLIGTFPADPRTGLPGAEMFTAADAQEVDRALLATEMNTVGACGATVGRADPSLPNECLLHQVIFSDNFESGAPGWTTEFTGAEGGIEWALRDNIPYPRTGQAWFQADNATFDAFNSSDGAAFHLRSPVITLPPVLDRPTLSFWQYYTTWAFGDGGNLKISVDGGPWTLVPPCFITHNSYNSYLLVDYTPLFRESTWSGIGGAWAKTIVDLTTLVTGGQTVRFSFDFGDWFFIGFDGWYVDDVELYVCRCTLDSHCDDGLLCNGTATCVDGLCISSDACPGGHCDEVEDYCPPTAFFDDFESGNVNGWTLRGQGSTATDGDWLIGAPILTSEDLIEIVQPGTAYSGCGCAFTGQNPVNVDAGDVDGGVVYLVSPAIDLAGQDYATLSYVRWFYNDFDDGRIGTFAVDVSDDDGGTWVNVETLGPDESAASWTPMSFRLDAHIALTDTVRIRFAATDEYVLTGHVVEAAIDDMAVTLVDLCAFLGGTGEDCNGNGRKDWCDVEDLISADCNLNSIPDECDITQAVSLDCNANGAPDECDLVDGTSDDCNASGVPDECEPDCNGNGVQDTCDITDATSPDCNTNAIPDECDLADATSADCNTNAIPDECDTAAGTSGDCNFNTVPDECEPDEDCNTNGVRDICDIGAGTASDCNGNSIPDQCDLSSGSSGDYNLNGVPDDCESRPIPEDTLAIPCVDDEQCPNESFCVLPQPAVGGTATCYVPKNRYLSIDPNPNNTDPMPARRVSLLTADVPIVLGWVGAPNAAGWSRIVAEADRHHADWQQSPIRCENGSDCPSGTCGLDLFCEGDTYGGTVSVGDCHISPGHTYLIEAIALGLAVDDEGNYSEPLSLKTVNTWGDVAGSTVAGVALPPDGAANFSDILTVVKGFQNAAAAPITWLDLVGTQAWDVAPDMEVSFSDILATVLAFQSDPYWFSDPCTCVGLPPCP